MQVRLRDLEIIAKNRIKLYLERIDSSALPLPLLDLRQELLAVAAQIAQFVEFFVHTALNRAAIDKGNRRLGHNSLVDSFPKITEFIEQSVKRCQSLGGESCQRNP